MERKSVDSCDSMKLLEAAMLRLKDFEGSYFGKKMSWPDSEALQWSDDYKSENDKGVPVPETPSFGNTSWLAGLPECSWYAVWRSFVAT